MIQLISLPAQVGTMSSPHYDSRTRRSGEEVDCTQMLRNISCLLPQGTQPWVAVTTVHCQHIINDYYSNITFYWLPKLRSVDTTSSPVLMTMPIGVSLFVLFLFSVPLRDDFCGFFFLFFIFLFLESFRPLGILSLGYSSSSTSDNSGKVSSSVHISFIRLLIVFDIKSGWVSICFAHSVVLNFSTVSWLQTPLWMMVSLKSKTSSCRALYCVVKVMLTLQSGVVG